jgi:hypothetical protein
VSASGCFEASYGGGWHEQLALCSGGCAGRPKGDIPNSDRPTMSQIQSWTGTSNVGLGATTPRWSCNSDKWLNQRFNWDWDNSSHGDNSFACNWVDHQAILLQMSVNEHATGSEFNSGKVIVGNCTGDLWVAGDPANSWEDVTGQWHIVVPTEADGIGPHAVAPAFCIRSEIRGILISAPARSAVEVINSKGRIVAHQKAGGEFLIGKGMMAPGSYIIRVTSDNTQLTTPAAIGL